MFVALHPGHPRHAAGVESGLRLAEVGQFSCLRAPGMGILPAFEIWLGVPSAIPIKLCIEGRVQLLEGSTGGEGGGLGERE